MSHIYVKMDGLFFVHVETDPRGPGPPHYRSFFIIPHSVGLLWTRDESDAVNFTFQNTHRQETAMTPAGFEPPVPATKRPQTHPLDGAATGIGMRRLY
jgi:hypothetical protein